MPQITKELAERIVKKAGGVFERSMSTAHDIYGVYKGEILIATLSIRRGSRKDIGHDFIPGAMSVSTNFAKQFGRCNKSVDDWHAELAQKGLLP